MKDNAKKSSSAKLWGMFAAGAAVGLPLGGAAVYRVMVMPYQKIIADQFVSSVMSDTHNAIRLRQGKSIEIAQRIDSNFSNDVLMIRSVYRDHPMSLKALQNIRSYYQKNNLPVPPQIQQIFNNMLVTD